MSRTPLAVKPTLCPTCGGDCPAASNRRLCAPLITRTGFTPALSNFPNCRSSAFLSFTTNFRYLRMPLIHTRHAQTISLQKGSISHCATFVTGRRPSHSSLWSSHWIDLATAVPQLKQIGVPVDLDELRELDPVT